MADFDIEYRFADTVVALTKEKLLVAAYPYREKQEFRLGGYGGIQHCLIPAPKHIIIDKDENGDYTTKLFAKEQSHKSMLKILGY